MNNKHVLGCYREQTEDFYVWTDYLCPAGAFLQSHVRYLPVTGHAAGLVSTSVHKTTPAAYESQIIAGQHDQL